MRHRQMPYLGILHPRNIATMKKVSNKRPSRSVEGVTPRKETAEADGMRPHYDFDYSKARPNRFAERITQETIVVALDPDVG